MPVEFLSDEQVARFGRFVAEPSALELERCFRLDADALRLGFAQRADASCLQTYAERPKTAYEHPCEIRRECGYREFAA